MRCFLMKAGRICSVDYLLGKTDEALIEKAHEIFETKVVLIGAEGFEVWDHTRFIYRYVVEGREQHHPSADGLKASPTLLERFIRKWALKFSIGAVPRPGAFVCAVSPSGLFGR